MEHISKTLVELSAQPKDGFSKSSQTTQDKIRLTRSIAVMAEAFCRPVTEITLYAYEYALSDVPIAIVEAAIIEAIRTRRYMPNVAEVRELCHKNTFVCPTSGIRAPGRGWDRPA